MSLKRLIASVVAIDGTLLFLLNPGMRSDHQISPLPERNTTSVVQEYKQDLGTFTMTFYTPYEDKYGWQTSTGEQSRHLLTCAVDPNIIPYGSFIKIYGDDGTVLQLKCIDCGGFRGKNIDIFFDGSQAEGYEFIENFGEIHHVYLVEE